jgi:hypothetical protein
MINRDVAAPYARERFDGHKRALARALADGQQADVSGLRNLAVHAERTCLLDPS